MKKVLTIMTFVTAIVLMFSIAPPAVAVDSQTLSASITQMMASTSSANPTNVKNFGASGSDETTTGTENRLNPAHRSLRNSKEAPPVR